MVYTNNNKDPGKDRQCKQEVHTYGIGLKLYLVEDKVSCVEVFI